MIADFLKFLFSIFEIIFSMTNDYVYMLYFVTWQIACHWNNQEKDCTAVAVSVDSTRDIVHTHNRLRAYVPPEPFSSRATPFQGIPTTSPGKEGPTSSSYSEDML